MLAQPQAVVGTHHTVTKSVRTQSTRRRRKEKTCVAPVKYSGGIIYENLFIHFLFLLFVLICAVLE